MESEQWILERRFSDLGALQKARILRYGYDCGAAGCRFFLENGSQAESLYTDGISSSVARQIVRFLYENAVLPEHWPDITGELIANAQIEERGCCSEVF